MKYNFDRVWDRRGKDSIKWDDPKKPEHNLFTQHEDFIPMSVADMDFATAPCVVDAIKERLEHPLFGYGDFPERYNPAIIKWHTERYEVQGLKEENILYQNSVLGGLSTFLSVYTKYGDKVLINSPAYAGFQRIIKNQGRIICDSPLKKDDNGVYRLDFLDIENKIVRESISAMIFCSPHNPTGRVWDKDEIEELVALCNKYQVKIISDEIWADFIMDHQKKHITTQSINETAKEITMAIYAPSKTFNTSGLFGAYSIIYNPQMMEQINAASIASGYNEKNMLACYALIGGYERGEDWVAQLLDYIRENQRYMVDFINANIPKVSAYLPEGTYLLWIDISQCKQSPAALFRKLKEAGLVLNPGSDYMSEPYLRMNAACPRAVCEVAMGRLKSVLWE